MSRKKATPKISSEQHVDKYKLCIKISGKTFESEGDTIADALNNLKAQNTKGRGVLIVEKDGKKRERILMPTLVYRMFNAQGLTREMALKNVSMLF